RTNHACYDAPVKFPRALAVLPLLALSALLFSACVSVENPQGWGAPAFTANAVYYQESKDHISGASLASDGSATRSWTFPDKNNAQDKDLSLKAIYGAPVVEGEAVYFSTFSAGVFALNKDTGRPIWRVSSGFSGDIVGGVSLGGGKVAFGTTDGDLHLLDAKDGKLAAGWPSGGVNFGKGVWAGPIIAGDVVYVASMDGTVDALKLADGSRTWPKPFSASGAIAEIRVLDEAHLFVPSLNKHVYILNRADGSIAQDFRASDWVWGGAAFKDNVAYFGDFAGHVYALDITTGKDRWPSIKLGNDRVKAAPQIVGDVVVFGDRQPTIHFLQASDGSRLGIPFPVVKAGTIRADGTTLQDGSVVFLTTNGRMFKADPKTQTVVELSVGGAGK
ncbi:MAG: PQQ-binding-like beta-propeller repeat protein, partial [Anaerolineaceae bacterium]